MKIFIENIFIILFLYLIFYLTVLLFLGIDILIKIGIFVLLILLYFLYKDIEKDINSKSDFFGSMVIISLISVFSEL